MFDVFTSFTRPCGSVKGLIICAFVSIFASGTQISHKNFAKVIYCRELSVSFFAKNDGKWEELSGK